MQMRTDTEKALGMNVPPTTSESTMHPPQDVPENVMQTY